MPVRNAQQDSAPVEFQFPHIQITCRGHKRVIVVIHRIAKGVIIHIYRAGALRKLCLICIVQSLKEFQRLLRAHLVPVKWQILLYQQTHLLNNCIQVLLHQRRALALLSLLQKYAIVSFGDWSAHKHLAIWEEVLCRLKEQKGERPAISPSTAVTCIVQKLHIPVVVDLKPKPLRNIVHPCRKNGPGLFKIKIGNHIHKRSSLFVLPICTCVLAKYPYHIIKLTAYLTIAGNNIFICCKFP